jgi:hypothetical protein
LRLHFVHCLNIIHVDHLRCFVHSCRPSALLRSTLFLFLSKALHYMRLLLCSRHKQPVALQTWNFFAFLKLCTVCVSCFVQGTNSLLPCNHSPLPYVSYSLPQDPVLPTH